MTDSTENGVDLEIVKCDVTNDEIAKPEFDTETNETETLTKAQIRKQRRLQRREDRHENFKQKQKQRRVDKKLKRVEAKEKGEPFVNRKRRRPTRTMAESNCKLQVAIDMRYDHLMPIEKDVVSNVSQLSQAYGVNRRLEDPLQFYVTSFDGASKKRWDTIHGTGGEWDIKMDSKPIETLFSPDKIVYLTSESENELDAIDDEKVYVIGGLVDHNAHKGICHQVALDNNWSHARLPLDKYMPKMKTRKVLAINHVFEILARYSVSRDWNQALELAVPTRKLDPISKKQRREDNKTNSEAITEAIIANPVDD